MRQVDGLAPPIGETMIGRLKCWFRGKHLRGKFVRALDNGRVKYFACPCCGRETSYKAPKA
jgi:hypothetical protein